MDRNGMKRKGKPAERQGVFFLLLGGLLLLGGCSLFFPGEASVSRSAFREGEWLMMVYMAGSNNLESAALEDIKEMRRGLEASGNDDVYVTVLLDRSHEDEYVEDNSSAVLGDGNWDDTGLYLLSREGVLPLDGTVLQGESFRLPNTMDSHQEGDETNLGDPEVLASFVSYSTKLIEADHSSLVLWNHGSGVRSSRDGTEDPAPVAPSVRGVCYDEDVYDSEAGEYVTDPLYTDEVQQALEAAGLGPDNRLDHIGFDACLMGMVEEAYEYRNHARTFSGSMANEWGYGWDYERLLEGLTPGAVTTAAGFAELAVQQYEDSTTQVSDQTQAAVDLAEMENLKTQVDALAVAMQDKQTGIETARDNSDLFLPEGNPFDFVDLYSLCEEIKADSNLPLDTEAGAVQTALEQAVIASYAGADYGGYSVADGAGRGLSIFMPYGEKTDTNGTSYYAYCWWYTAEDTQEWWEPGMMYGNIDFCTSNGNGTVEGWRELFEYWYDDEGYTPSDY